MEEEGGLTRVKLVMTPLIGSTEAGKEVYKTPSTPTE